MALETFYFSVLQRYGGGQVLWKDDAKLVRKLSVRHCVINKLSQVKADVSKLERALPFLKIPTSVADALLPENYLFIAGKFEDKFRTHYVAIFRIPFLAN